MRKIIINGEYMKDKESAHIYLKENLNICGYYGSNLDALWDALSTYSSPIEIELINGDRLIEYLKGYGNAMISVFKEAEEENSNINFKIVNK